MKVEIKPTQDSEKLVENLEKRVEAAELHETKVSVEVDEEKLEILERTPGIQSFTAQGEKISGLKGRPVQEEAYAYLESRKDFAEAVLATIQGYDLRVLRTNREWDLKLLRRFNPDIKHLKHDEPPEFLDIDKTLDEEDSERDYVGHEVSDEEVELVCNFAMPKTRDDS